MIKKVIRYGILTAIVIGIVLLMSTLLTGENSSFSSSNKNSSNSTKYYTASIRVLDKESKKFITGGEFVLKTSDGEVIEEWTAKDNIKRVSKLTNGTYIVEQKSALEGYEKSDNVTFKISNSSQDVVIYNEAIAEEVITSNEVSVDNTLSVKSCLSYITAIIVIGSGLFLIVNKKVRV